MSTTYDASADAAERLFANGRDFLNHGLSSLFSELERRRDVKMALVNLQMGLELFIKFRLVSEFGLQRIATRPLASVADLPAAIRDGTLKTKKYWECRDDYLAVHPLGSYAARLITTFQDYRNAIVHFGREINANECRVLCADLIFHVVRSVAGREGPLSSQPHSTNAWLDRVNYEHLVHYEPYVRAGRRRADDLSPEDPLRCFECGNPTLIEDEFGTSYECTVCGVLGDPDASPYVTCPFCARKHAFVYDGLNIEFGEVAGKCTYCNQFAYVVKCGSCDTILPREVVRHQTARGWRCDGCYDPEEPASPTPPIDPTIGPPSPVATQAPDNLGESELSNPGL